MYGALREGRKDLTNHDSMQNVNLNASGLAAYKLSPRTIRKHSKDGFCRWPLRKQSKQTRHPLYVTYGGIKTRCYNPACPTFSSYGGRGIKMCTEWYVSFERFVKDIEALGPRPKGHTLDRINNDDGYRPGNVRWANRKEQACNTRRTGPTPGLVYTNWGSRWRVTRCIEGKRYRSYFKCPVLAYIFYKETL